MRYITILFLFCVLLISCSEQPAPEAQSAGTLQRIDNLSDSQIEELKAAGAEIIVRESDYVVVRTTNMTKPMAFAGETIRETDMVQRLVHIHFQDTTALQQIMNSGIDFWQVDGDTVVARAFDYHIDNLKDAGFSIRIVASNASKWAEGIQ